MNHAGPGQAYLAKTPDGVALKDFSGPPGPMTARPNSVGKCASLCVKYM
jgi:hypothetical protein